MANELTMLGKIERHATERPNAPALHDKKGGGWETTTWSEYLADARAIGKGLMALGVEPKSCVALVGVNRADWVKCQLGINAAAAIPAPLYTTLLPEQMSYIVGNAQAKVGICDSQEQLDKFLAIAEEEETTLEHIVTMDDLGASDERVLTLDELKAKGEEVSDEDQDAILAEVQPEDVALLIYTSGTTGLPKGAMLSHEGTHAIAESAIERYGSIMNSSLRYISYLPLCHAAEQGFTNFGGLEAGGQVYFCPDMKKVKDYLVEAIKKKTPFSLRSKT